MAGIGALGRGQPFGAKSKQYLLELVSGKAVAIEGSKRDRYGRSDGCKEKDASSEERFVATAAEVAAGAR